jgi:hypothetical protein
MLVKNQIRNDDKTVKGKNTKISRLGSHKKCGVPPLSEVAFEERNPTFSGICFL